MASFLYIRPYNIYIEWLTSQASHENDAQQGVESRATIHLDIWWHLSFFFKNIYIGYIDYIFFCFFYPSGNPETMLELVAVNLSASGGAICGHPKPATHRPLTTVAISCYRLVTLHNKASLDIVLSCCSSSSLVLQWRRVASRKGHSRTWCRRQNGQRLKSLSFKYTKSVVCICKYDSFFVSQQLTSHTRSDRAMMKLPITACAASHLRHRI